MTPPVHAFEVKLTIGANTWEYVLRALREMADHVERCGDQCSLASGGWDGCHSIDISKRDITPEAYRDELEAWRESVEVAR